MGKAFRSVGICLILTVFLWFGMVLADRQALRTELIRIHVVANSDTPEDQSLKLSVRDAVVESLRTQLCQISDPEAARSYLRQKLPYIQQLARQTLQALGCDASVAVRFQKEAMDRSTNGLLSLPAGVYDSLRIIIGEGQGENWWSVVFPELVTGLLISDTEEAAPAFSGESSGNKELRIHFLLLDLLGRLENIFCAG